MSPIRFYLDEDVSDVIAEILRSSEIIVVTTHGMRRKGLSDNEQLRFAAENAYVAVTHNRNDYQALAVQYFEEGLTHSGLILAVRRPPSQMASRLKDISYPSRRRK